MSKGTWLNAGASTVARHYSSCKMANVRDSDTSLWLHNKLGTSNDSWTTGSICTQLNAEVLKNIKDCFPDLQTQVKLKLLLSFFHIPRRNVEEVCNFSLRCSMVLRAYIVIFYPFLTHGLSPRKTRCTTSMYVVVLLSYRNFITFIEMFWNNSFLKTISVIMYIYIRLVRYANIMNTRKILITNVKYCTYCCIFIGSIIVTLDNVW